MGIVSEGGGGEFATPRNPEACGGLWMVPLISNASQSRNHRTLQTTTSLSLPSARYTT